MPETTLLEAAMYGGLAVSFIIAGLFFFYMIIMENVRSKVREEVNERVERHERIRHND